MVQLGPHCPQVQYSAVTGMAGTPSPAPLSWDGSAAGVRLGDGLHDGDGAGEPAGERDGSCDCVRVDEAAAAAGDGDTDGPNVPEVVRDHVKP